MDPDAIGGVSRVPHGGSDDADLVDFSANTNPERPAGVAEVYEAALADATSYADDHPDFRAAAADYVECDAERVVPTAGGIAALRLAFGVTVAPGDRVAVPEPGFGEYAREVRLQGGTPVGVASDRLLGVDPAGYAAVVICTPNNPTGDLPDPDAGRDARRAREQARVAKLQVLAEAATARRLQANATGGRPAPSCSKSNSRPVPAPCTASPGGCALCVVRGALPTS